MKRPDGVSLWGVRCRRKLSTSFVLALALVAFFQGSASAAVVPLPKLSHKASVISFQGRPALLVRSLLVRSLPVRRVKGDLTVRCTPHCRRRRTKIRRSYPTRTSKRFSGANWILRRGQGIELSVTRRGKIGRYLRLTVTRRGRLRLVFEQSGCLNRRGRRIRCPRGTPQPPIGQPVPPIPPPDAPAIYGVKEDGDLLWYRHNGRLDGSSAWTGPRTVGTAWNFKHVFSGGDGVVYAVKDNGDLLWTRHNGWLDGSWAWARPRTVGTAWSGFSRVVGVGAQE